MDKSQSKIKGNSVRIISNMVDRVGLAPALAGIARACPVAVIGMQASVLNKC